MTYAAQGLALAALIIQTHGQDGTCIAAFISWGRSAWAPMTPSWLPEDERDDFPLWVGQKIVGVLGSRGFEDRGPVKFLAWTKKIARCEAINRTRQYKRAALHVRAYSEDKRLALAAGRYLHGQDREVEEAVLAAEAPARSQRARALVQAILDSPSLNEREKFILRQDLLGTSNAQIAATLSEDPHRISQLRHSAILKARRYLSSQGINRRDFGWSPLPKKAPSPSSS